MEAALQLHQHGLDALATVDSGAMTPNQIGHGLLQLQKHVDRLAVIHARFCAEAANANVHAGTGHRDLASWLAAKGKTSKGRAVRQQKLGEALNASPKLADAVTNGTLTPDAAGELLPTFGSNHSGDIDELIDACAGATPAEAKAAGELFQELNKPAGETDRQAEDRKRAKRFLRLSNIGDGTTTISGLVPMTDARTIRDALASIVDQWDDRNDPRTHEQRDADALVELCHGYAAGTVTGGRQAPHVTVVIDIADLIGSGVGINDKGEIVPAEYVRQLLPHAWVSRLLTACDVPLNCGREQRLASDAQFRAIIARDGAYCRMPGCCIPAKWCQVDHVLEWDAENGPTDIDWLVLFCSYHHHLRHTHGTVLHGDANNLSITLPNGDWIDLPPKRHAQPAGTATAGEPPGDEQLPLDHRPAA
ncbi:MAG: DUF222 domain-containing protein [Ilumatobacteraceae bacterium]